MSSARHPARNAWPPGLPTAVGAFLASVLAIPPRASAAEDEARTRFALRLLPPTSTMVSRLAEQDARPAPPAAEAGRPDLGFDLLGPGEKPPAVDEDSVALRRKMLTYHPLLGIGLLVCETATVVMGQLSYTDRFGGGPSSGRYERAHLLLAAGTAALFVGTGLLAILAPNPLHKKHQGFDRVLLHKIGMFTAAAGMATTAALGIYTARREGYLNQESYARAHLVIGYATLAATYLAVSSFLF